ncbi:MAG: FtsX-like permease family protein [Archangium sp.]|nr:FtsX-like permease family protein [Archangium sp.]MDP3157936.1 FtsX-like permease family protein [Archangium sp.]MDP3572114.1 FtsX-like permease family protein [Archangium sp.]
MLLRIAFLSLWQHRRRTGVLMVAIGMVTALMVMMLGIGEGMNRSLVETSTTLMSGHINVAGFFKVTAGQAAPVVTKAQDVLATIRKEVPELTYVASRGRGWAKVVSETNSTMIGLGGIDITQEQGLLKALKVKEGKLEDLARPGSIMLFEEQAATLNVRVGDALTISAPTARGTNNTVDVVVVAIVKGMGMMSQFSCFMNEATLRQLYQLKDDTTGALQIYLTTSDLGEIKKVQSRLREGLSKAGYTMMDEDPRAFWFKFENVSREPWVGQRLDLTNWHDEVSFVAWTVDLMSFISFFLGTVLLAVIGVGIMIVMWISIRERTREIGTLRAIGMQQTSVLLMFLTEGFLLGLLATLGGAVAGVLISVILNSAHIPLPVGVQFVLLSDKLVMLPTAQWVLATVLFITGVVTFISVIPSFIAARLKPVSAMQHAG